MLKLHLHVELGQPAVQVWEIVGKFDGFPAWHPLVKESRLESAPAGVGRRVRIEGGTAGPRELIERLVSYDAARCEYAYMIVGGPTNFTDYVGRFKVVPTGPKSCTLNFDAQFKAAPGSTDAEATARIQTFYEAALTNLRSMMAA